jgi:hypothetical protein
MDQLKALKHWMTPLKMTDPNSWKPNLYIYVSNMYMSQNPELVPQFSA